MVQAGSDTAEPPRWSHPSVLAFAAGADPLERILTVTRDLMSAAADEGVPGPPFEPVAIAKLLGLRVHARADVNDARITVDAGGPRRGDSDATLSSFVPSITPLVVEYNPTRPRGRVRYSMAHEIAHALFADVAEIPRHRTGSGAVPGDDDSWQLEMLCNVAAAEILMPAEAVEGLAAIDVDIDYLMEQRRRFDVSTEALLRRVTTASTRPMCMLSLLRVSDRVDGQLRVEYSVGSRSFPLSLDRGFQLPSVGGLETVTAVGQTVRAELELGSDVYRIEAVGSPPYPGRAMPRVLALVTPLDAARMAPAGLQFVSGDVSKVTPGSSPVVIAHVTNDSAPGWGARGVARALAARYPSAKSAYRQWALQSGNLKLGRAHIVEASEQPGVHVASLVAQKGYGPGSPPRLVYRALAKALATTGDRAIDLGAEVHLPRLGTGQAGGRWDLVEAEIDETLLRRDVVVTVHTLPQGRQAQ